MHSPYLLIRKYYLAYYNNSSSSYAIKTHHCQVQAIVLVKDCKEIHVLLLKYMTDYVCSQGCALLNIRLPDNYILFAWQPHIYRN
jgi:hypothetical protein